MILNMENPFKINHICDQCGRSISKIHRRYRGELYCTACYYREFEPRPCPQCGNKARLHRKHPEAVCQTCENSSKPCIRCLKTGFKIGKQTELGPVCHACSVHFRKPKKCAYCGEFSKNLSRDTALGFEEQACTKCRRQKFETCSMCRRHRLTVKTPNGKPICTKCQELGEIDCPVCHELMPAGYGRKCETCSTRQRINNAIDQHCGNFTNPKTAVLYREYYLWLETQATLKTIASKLNHYRSFFIQLDNLPGIKLSYRVLLKHFGANGLRKFLLPVKFFSTKYELTVVATEKNEDSEQRQIKNLLHTNGIDSPSRKILDEFHAFLIDKTKSGTVNIRSVRLALTPAVHLLGSIGTENLPNQHDLIRYLRKKPGQRAAISGFVGFMKKRYNVEWSLPKKIKKAKTYERQEAENKLIKLLRNPKTTENYRQKLLKTKLWYFHGLKINPTLGKIEIKHTDQHDQYVEFSGNRYWLPN